MKMTDCLVDVLGEYIKELREQLTHTMVLRKTATRRMVYD